MTLLPRSAILGSLKSLLHLDAIKVQSSCSGFSRV